MSTFSLKIIALITMFIDHSSIFLYSLGKLSLNSYFLLRGIGRIAFPIYCFLLVNGFGYSSDKKKYLSRLMGFALISQIPFSLYFSQGLFPCIYSGPFQFKFLDYYLIVPLLLFIAFYLSLSNKPSLKTLLLGCIFIILPGFKMSFGCIYLLDGDMSVFYSLSIGLALVYFISELKEQNLSILSKILGAVLLFFILTLIQPLADYGISAIILICGLYFTRSKKAFQAVFICIWAFFQYGFVNKIAFMYSMFASLTAVALLLYNGKKGPSAKYFFYGFYPVHLLCLSLIAAALSNPV